MSPPPKNYKAPPPAQSDSNLQLSPAEHHQDMSSQILCQLSHIHLPSSASLLWPSVSSAGGIKGNGNGFTGAGAGAGAGRVPLPPVPVPVLPVADSRCQKAHTPVWYVAHCPTRTIPAWLQLASAQAKRVGSVTELLASCYHLHVESVTI